MDRKHKVSVKADIWGFGSTVVSKGGGGDL
jgi:hypothetical protein